MLGMVAQSSQSWKTALGNFITVWLVQFAFKLNDAWQYAKALPTYVDLYGMCLTSLIVTLVFYGYNKLKEEAKKE